MRGACFAIGPGGRIATSQVADVKCAFGGWGDFLNKYKEIFCHAQGKPVDIITVSLWSVDLELLGTVKPF